MTESAVFFTNLQDSKAAGAKLGADVSAAFQGKPPDAVIVFASSRFDHVALLEAIQAGCKPALMVGCSSAGEFTRGSHGESSACVMALRSEDIHFSAGIGRGLSSDRTGAARGLVSTFKSIQDPERPHRYALVFADALAAYTDDFIERLSTLTAGRYQFVGGGAGDDAKFERTHVFYGTQGVSDAAVALEMRSRKPLGIGVHHGWEPGSDAMRVTQSDGARLISLDAVPAVDKFKEYAERTGQQFDPANPIPFFLHNVLGIKVGDNYKLRVPLGVQADGSLLCASDIPDGSIVHIMKTTIPAAIGAAKSATKDALVQLQGNKPRAALFFDCVATRLRMGKDFGNEIASVGTLLGDAQIAGFNTYGQIARTFGQFSGFHNCTAVVCVIPD